VRGCGQSVCHRGDPPNREVSGFRLVALVIRAGSHDSCSSRHRERCRECLPASSEIGSITSLARAKVDRFQSLGMQAGWWIELNADGSSLAGSVDHFSEAGA
jgi:hypothetical protein